MRSARFLIGGAAALALALSAAAHLAAIGGIDVEARYPQVWWLHATAMVLCFAGIVYALRLAGPKPRFRDVVATLPAWASAAIAVAFVYVIATFFLLVPATGAGDPVVTDGRYFFNDHGTMREVGATEFHAQRAVSLRLYSAVWAYLCLIPTLLLLLARRQTEVERRPMGP